MLLTSAGVEPTTSWHTPVKNAYEGMWQYYIDRYGIYANIFAEKNVSSFCFYWYLFSKNTCELDIVLTRTVNIRPLASSLSLQCFEQLGSGLMELNADC